MSEQLYHIPELLWSFLMAVVRALSPGRKISDLPPSITKTVTIVVSLMCHVPCMTRTPTRYPHQFIWVWCVGLDPRSAPNNWGHSKPTPGYVYGLCAPRSGSGSRNPRDYKMHSAEPWEILCFLKKVITLPARLFARNSVTHEHSRCAAGYYSNFGVRTGPRKTPPFLPPGGRSLCLPKKRLAGAEHAEAGYLTNIHVSR